MENRKAELTAGMVEKINELNTALDNLSAIVADYEDALASGTDAFKDMQDKLEQAQAEKAQATDIASAKKLAKKVAELEADMELQRGVNVAVASNKLTEVDGAITDLLNTHKTASFLFGSVKAECRATVSLRSLKEDTELLTGFATKINNSLRIAVRNLIDFGFITQADSSRAYKGIHLGQRPLVANLETVFAPEVRY
jgi:hypothetical protein